MKYLIILSLFLLACEKDTVTSYTSEKQPIKTKTIAKPNPGLPYHEFQRAEWYKNGRLIAIRYYYIIDCNKGQHYNYEYSNNKWDSTTSFVNVTNRCLWNDTIGDTYK